MGEAKNSFICLIKIEILNYKLSNFLNPNSLIAP